MDILVSFRNVQTPGRPLLALLDTASLSLRAVKLPVTLGEAASIAGTAVTDDLLFATVHQRGGQGDTDGSSSLVVFDRKTLRVVKQHHLHGQSDLQGLAVQGETLYVVSAGTDELIELNLRGAEIVSSRCLWRPDQFGPRADLHHLSGVAVAGSQVFVTGFGRRSGSSWNTARDGFVANVTRDERVVTGLQQPQSPFAVDGRIVYCEAGTRSVRVVGESASRYLGGYTRGLCILGEQVLVGVSGGAGAEDSWSGVTVLSAAELQIEQSADLGGYAVEIASLLPIDGTADWPIVADAAWQAEALSALESRLTAITADATRTRTDIRRREEELARRAEELSRRMADLADAREQVETIRQDAAASRQVHMEQVNSASQRATEMHEMLMQLHRQLKERTDELWDRTETMAKLEGEIQAGAATIAALKREIAEKSSGSAIAEQELALLNQRMASMQAEVQGQRQTVTNFEDEVERRGQAIIALTNEMQRRGQVIAQLETRLREIYESKVWQVAAGYWKFKKETRSGGITRAMNPGTWRRVLSPSGAPPLPAPSPAVNGVGLSAAAQPSQVAAQPAPIVASEPAASQHDAGTPESAALQASVSALGEALVRLVATYEARYGASPLILDWTRSFDLSTFQPAGVVFSPPFADETLPYFDASVDIVAVERDDLSRLAEARRVASGCVVTIEPGSHLLSADGNAASSNVCEIEWRSEPPIKPLPSVTIVIPVYNKSDLTDGCLTALMPTLEDVPDVSIVVVDDASKDDTPALLKAWAERDPRVRSIRNEQNMGFVDTCNRGAASADTDVILFLNNDTIPLAGWLEPLLRLFRDDPKVGVAGSKLLFGDGRLQEAGGCIFQDGTGWNIGRNEADPEAALYTFVREVDYCSGAVLATPRALWEEIGGFDIRYRPAYYEDVDYCFTVRDRGYRVLYQPQSTVIHLEGGTGGTDTSVGPKKAQVDNHLKFAEKWREVLKTQHTPPEKPNRAGFHQIIAPPGAKRILVSAPLVPEFDREGGSRRLFHLVEYLVADGWMVTFLAPHGQKTNRYKRILEQLGVCVYLPGEAPLIGEAYATEAERLIALGQFDVAILAFWNLAEMYMPLIRRHSPKTRIMVDSIDLHFVRQARGTFKPHAFGWERKTLDAHYADSMIRELNVYAEADQVLTVSQKEADIVNDLTGDGRKAWSVPLTDDLPISEIPLSERRGMLFLGNFRHPPNVEGLEYLCREIVPFLDEKLLEKHPIWVVGTGLDDRIREIGKGLKHVHMIGWVPFTTPYLHRARITAVPLLHGAGMKSKMVQALMAATPTVSTNIGVEGMELEDGEHVLVANAPRPFAENITRLLTDDDLWENLAQNGRKQIMAVYSRAAIRDMFFKALHEVMEQDDIMHGLRSPMLS